MAAPKGNTYGTANKGNGRPKLFDQSLRLAIQADNGKKLRSAAEKLLSLAASGEQWAVLELANRLDGKAHQTLDADFTFTHQVRELSDDKLVDIASGGSARIVDATECPEELEGVRLLQRSA